MLEGRASKEEVQRIVDVLTKNLASHAPKYKSFLDPVGEKSEAWTKAVWESFEDVRRYLQENSQDTWHLYPNEPGKGCGKPAGEYLVDFCIFSDATGPRIACESEMGNRKENFHDWAFDKLRGTQADIHIFIVECGFQSDGLPKHISAITQTYLSKDIHLRKGEHYVVVQLQGDQSRWFHWSPSSDGIAKEPIIFKRLERLAKAGAFKS